MLARHAHFGFADDVDNVLSGVRTPTGNLRAQQSRTMLPRAAPPPAPVPVPGQRPTALQLVQALIDRCSDPRPAHTAWLDDWIDDRGLRAELRAAVRPTGSASTGACACSELRRIAKNKHVYRELALLILLMPDRCSVGAHIVPHLSTRLQGVKLRVAPLLGLGYSHGDHATNVSH
jgi:hypothetical protein